MSHEKGVYIISSLMSGSFCLSRDLLKHILYGFSPTWYLLNSLFVLLNKRYSTLIQSDIISIVAKDHLCEMSKNTSYMPIKSDNQRTLNLIVLFEIVCFFKLCIKIIVFDDL